MPLTLCIRLWAKIHVIRLKVAGGRGRYEAWACQTTHDSFTCHVRLHRVCIQCFVLALAYVITCNNLLSRGNCSKFTQAADAYTRALGVRRYTLHCEIKTYT